MRLKYIQVLFVFFYSADFIIMLYVFKMCYTLTFIDVFVFCKVFGRKYRSDVYPIQNKFLGLCLPERNSLIGMTWSITQAVP